MECVNISFSKTKYQKCHPILGLILAVILAHAPQSLGAVIFVDNQLPADCIGTYSIANRDNSGSDGDAYNTPQEAADAVSPGDTVFIREGTYHITVVISKSGTATQPIIVANYDDENAVFVGDGFVDEDNDGDGFADGPLAGKQTLFLVEGDYIHLSGLEFMNSTATGLRVAGSYNIIEDCISHDNWMPNFYVGDNPEGKVIEV